jgi:hypothetical protein
MRRVQKALHRESSTGRAVEKVEGSEAAGRKVRVGDFVKGLAMGQPQKVFGIGGLKRGRSKHRTPNLKGSRPER